MAAVEAPRRKVRRDDEEVFWEDLPFIVGLLEVGTLYGVALVIEFVDGGVRTNSRPRSKYCGSGRLPAKLPVQHVFGNVFLGREMLSHT